MPIYKLDKKNSNGQNQYKVRVNYTDKDGNHKTVNRNIYGKAEAKALELRLTEKLKSTPTGADLTLETVYNEYMASIKPEVRFSTYDRKVVIFNNHIAPFLKDKTLKELTRKYLPNGNCGWKKSLWRCKPNAMYLRR